MGMTRVPVSLRVPSSSGTAYTAEFVVDTGAIDSVAPASALHRVGIRPIGTMTYELADGSRHDYEIGLVQIELMGETTAGRVVFGAEDIEPILGVTALESIGVVVDPVKKELRRLPALPLRRVATAAATFTA